jgi:hypothetical protein
MKNVLTDWRARACKGRTSTRFCLSAQGWSNLARRSIAKAAATTLGYKQKILKLDAPFLRGVASPGLLGRAHRDLCLDSFFKINDWPYCQIVASAQTVQASINMNQAKSRVINRFREKNFITLIRQNTIKTLGNS